MDRLFVKNAPVIHYSISERVEYGKKDSVPIDQSSVQSFNIDPVTGRPLYDLTAVVRAQSKAEQQRVLDMMVKFDSDWLPDDVTNDMALKYSFPRYAQMPSELAELTEKVNAAKFEEWRKSKQIEDEKKAREEYDALVAEIRSKRSKSSDDDDETKNS